ncbi:MAG: polysaccharide biosynthesis C-terminal domain-containing protein [Bacteroidetes bacterium]|nr:polysaccharide biosynthesis C-terminal domain-containing protein [Bacteroidota bacterium]
MLVAMAFASPVAQSVLLRLLTALLNLVLLGYTARMLGPGVRGEISLLIATLGIALHIAGMGGGSQLVYLLPRHPHGGIYRRALLWTTATAAGVALVALLVQANLPLHPALWPALLFAFLWGNLNRWMLVARGAILVDHRLNVGNSLLQLVLLAGLLYGGAPTNLMTFGWVLLVSWALIALWSGLLLLPARPKSPTYSTESGGVRRADQPSQTSDAVSHAEQPSQTSDAVPLGWGQQLRLGFYAQGTDLILLLGNRLAYYLLAATLGSSVLGRYALAQALAEAFWSMSRSINVWLAGRISRSTEQDPATSTMRWCRYAFWNSGIGCALLIAVPDELWVRLLGDGFRGLSGLLPWLAPGMIALAYQGTLMQYYAGTGQFRRNATTASMALLSLALSAPLLLYFMGDTGVALAQSLSLILSAAFITRRFQRDTRLSLGQMLTGQSPV